MKSYYYHAIALKVLVAVVDIFCIDFLYENFRNHDNLGMGLNIAALVGSGIGYYFANDLQKSEAKSLHALNAEKTGKTLENKLKPDVVKPNVNVIPPTETMKHDGYKLAYVSGAKSIHLPKPIENPVTISDQACKKHWFR